MVRVDIPHGTWNIGFGPGADCRSVDRFAGQVFRHLAWRTGRKFWWSRGWGPVGFAFARTSIGSVHPSATS